MKNKITKPDKDCKVWAYLHKKDETQGGLLSATSYRDARYHLGSCYKIKTIRLTSSDQHRAETMKCSEALEKAKSLLKGEPF